METPTIPRRKLVGSVVSLLTAGALAGCTGDGTADGNGDDTATGEGGGDSDTATDDMNGGDERADVTETDSSEETETAGTDELEFAEANVVGVEFESQGKSSYRFDVSLHHDDDGEEGYANWWQVEDLSGNQLGRRELLHAHSQQPFTRSETVDLPDGVSCVVVRGHDQTHGYGGAAMVVDIDSGAANTVRQGSDRQSIGESDCP